MMIRTIGRGRTAAMLLGATIALGVTTVGASAASAQVGDAAKGKATFARCMICHSVEPGANKLGPTLAGVVGRKSGSVPGYTYSAAMKGSNLVWTSANLDKYLTNPRAMVPGNKMIFAGLPQAPDRANVIAYLTNPAAVK